MSAAVRAGYKLTEVGVIPEDWDASSIGSNCKWMSGGTPPRSNVEYWNGTIPWISGSTLKSIEISTSDQFLTAEAVSAGSKMAPVDSTLLLVRGSALHNEIRAGLVVAPVAFNQDVKALVPNATVEAKFLTYYILAYSDQLLKLVSSAGNSAGVLDTELVQNFKFLSPPLPEQRAIVIALSDVDALLAKLDALVAKKRDLKVAAMQQLLTGQTRLPGFGGAWEVKRLDALADIRSGGTPSTTEPKFWNGDVLWCTPTDITGLGGFKYLSQTSRTITNIGLVASSAELIPVGSIVMTSRATIGECAINSVPMTTNQGFKNLIPFPSTDGEFLYYLLQTKKQEFIGLCSGSTFLEIGKTQLIRFEVKVPAKTEQTAIATVLSDMDTELTSLEARRDKTRAVKQGMMQELLTGRIRLVNGG